MGQILKKIELENGHVEVQYDTDMGNGEWYVYHVLPEDGNKQPVYDVARTQKQAEDIAFKLAQEIEPHKRHVV